jgi:tetratricopeptide (TPR) repeat protein
VRAKLAPSLEARPSTKPSNPTILDQYELLIEETLLAGRVQDAYELYWFGLGIYELGLMLGDSARGLRIAERFVPRDDFSLIEPHLSLRDRAVLVNGLGLFAKDLGDLVRAREALGHSRDLSQRDPDRKQESMCFQNIAWLELDAGCFRKALEYSEAAVRLVTEAKENQYIVDALSYRAAARFALGDITDAAADFQSATQLQGKPLYALRAIWEAESKHLRGGLQERLTKHKRTGVMRLVTTITPIFAAPTPSSFGSSCQMTPPELRSTFRRPAPSPAARA